MNEVYKLMEHLCANYVLGVNKIKQNLENNLMCHPVFSALLGAPRADFRGRDNEAGLRAGPRHGQVRPAARQGTKLK